MKKKNPTKNIPSHFPMYLNELKQIGSVFHVKLQLPDTVLCCQVGVLKFLAKIST